MYINSRNSGYNPEIMNEIMDCTQNFCPIIALAFSEPNWQTMVLLGNIKNMSDFGLTENQLALCEKHLDLLEKWNKVYNLTAIRNRSEMQTKHLFDSLAVLAHLPNQANFKMLDVGTGGGFPGIPLAIAKPDWAFTLIDSSVKKVRFLKQVASELGLKNVNPIHTRVEDYQVEQKFDGIISRAFASIDKMVSLTNHLLAEGGQYFAMKGPEQEKLPNTVSLVKDIKVDVPNLDAERHLLILKKT